jgi:hypothetical protein
MKEVKAVLAIITESKKLIVGLKVSISSPSPELRMIDDGIVPYLNRRQRAMQIRQYLVAFRVIWTKSTWRKIIRFW